MRATFLSFEVAKSGIQSAQMGLDITGQNMAKMNTEGYSRQILRQSTVYYDTSTYKYALSNIDKFGQGVSVDDIEQARDQFLDVRYRIANSEDSALAKISDILNDVNSLFDETLNNGLVYNFEDFYANLQTLSNNAGKPEYSGLVRSSAQMITESLSYYYKQLQKVEDQHEYDLGLSIEEINTLLTKIDDLNTSIRQESLYGNPTNDLLDSRNLFLDNLSAQINITVENNSDGTVSIKTGDDYLLDAANGIVATVEYQNTGDEYTITADGVELDITGGETLGFLDGLNGKGSFATTGENDFTGIKYYMLSLDALAKNFADKMNELNGDGKPLFVGETALEIGLSDEWLADATFITETTDPTASGNGYNDNILRMIAAMDEEITQSPSFSGTYSGFASSLMYEVAIDYNYYTDLSESASTVLNSVDNQRESVKGVSLNEETVNLIKYQKAFEASARVMTALDEMLNTIINNMGVVGR